MRGLKCLCLRKRWASTISSGTLVSVYDHADILALGESGHRRKVDSDLKIRLIRDPEFSRKVRFIVVEFGDYQYQAILDRYIRGEDVALEELEQVWTKTTQFSVWESPVYAEFFAAVREVNRKLPRDKDSGAGGRSVARVQRDAEQHAGASTAGGARSGRQGVGA